MTKVPAHMRRCWLLALCFAAVAACVEPALSETSCPKTAAELYSRLRTVGLDEQRVYRVRGAAIDRPGLQIVFDTGTIAFTQDICGRTTGALFEGEGEVLLRPPNKVERASLAMFTGMAILEEQFTTAYVRFNDETAASLQPSLSSLPDGAEFAKRWNEVSQSLAESDGLRLLLDFSHFLPQSGPEVIVPQFPRLMHAHLQGKKLGGFEIFWDTTAVESLWAGQIRKSENIPFWDIWASFTPNAPGGTARSPDLVNSDVSITGFRIRSSVQPPTMLRTTAEVDVLVRKGGSRTVLFELSRYLRIDSVRRDGQPVDFIQNESVEGTQLRRKGNDLVAVVFPMVLASGQSLKLTFSYGGEVLSEAGNGLLYVGARGTWYPSFGVIPAQFDLEFQYPASWMLVATGKQVPGSDPSESPGLQSSHWVSEGPIPLAGFNLGKYVRAEAKSGSVVVEAYGTSGVERSFPKAPPEVIEPVPSPSGRRGSAVLLSPPPPPSPARNAQAVADKAARAVTSFSQWFGPYPFHTLALTQMPGDVSQGWPSLVFLSSYAFLTPQEQSELHLDPTNALLGNQVLAHETAHQWWGDLVLWNSYRDQWIVEGLANYSALLILEHQNPTQFRQAMDRYRADLLGKNKEGEPIRDAGPVTLGQRLVSSRFPGAYETISYERGTWLFHMLRCMLRDSETVSHSRNSAAHSEEPFFRALRKIRERYAGKTLTTQDLVKVFEEELPRSLWFEKRRSLDWFLDGWINGTALPKLETRDVRIIATERGLNVSGTIVQSDAPDDLVTPVPVYATTAGNATVFLGRVLADGAETPFHFNVPAGTRKIVLDPKQTLLTATK